MSAKVSKQVPNKSPPLDNNTIFARIQLYHKILKNTNTGNGINDGHETADFLILKNKVIYRCYGQKPYIHSPGMDYSFYNIFTCQIFDIPDGIFDIPVIHDLFEIVHFTSTNFIEIVYYRANGHKTYLFPESNDKTLYEFLFEINKKQKIILSHKTCQRAYADFVDRQNCMMEKYNKLNPMRLIYHYASLTCEHKILKTEYNIISEKNELHKNNIKTLEEENKLYKNNIKALEEEINKLKDMYSIERISHVETIENLQKKYTELKETCDVYAVANLELKETCDAYAAVNAELKETCEAYAVVNAELKERAKILDESNF